MGGLVLVIPACAGIQRTLARWRMLMRGALASRFRGVNDFRAEMPINSEAH